MFRPPRRVAIVLQDALGTVRVDVPEHDLAVWIGMDEAVAGVAKHDDVGLFLATTAFVRQVMDVQLLAGFAQLALKPRP